MRLFQAHDSDKIRPTSMLSSSLYRGNRLDRVERRNVDDDIFDSRPGFKFSNKKVKY